MKQHHYQKMTDIPGVGPSIAEDLIGLGFDHPAQLAGADPDAMYAMWMSQHGTRERCMHYVFRCAVYCVETPKHQHIEPLTKWWHWKDKE